MVFANSHITCKKKRIFILSGKYISLYEINNEMLELVVLIMKNLEKLIISIIKSIYLAIK